MDTKGRTADQEVAEKTGEGFPAFLRMILGIAAACGVAALAACDSPPPPTHPGDMLYLGPSAKMSGELLVEVNPVMKLDGFSRRQVYELRKREVSRHPELAKEGYQPNEEVFGAIADGKPWWGFEGLYFYGDGFQSIEGLSEESRFISNPFLLVGIRETVSPKGQVPDGSTDYYPVPTRLTWNAAESRARATYEVANHFNFTISHRYPEKAVHELQFVLYNAKDLGFRFYSLDAAQSVGIEMETPSDKPRDMNQYIHCGGSCGYPGGCNNMSPFSQSNFFQVTEMPARATLKLWKQRAPAITAPADMSFVIEMN